MTDSMDVCGPVDGDNRLADRGGSAPPLNGAMLAMLLTHTSRALALAAMALVAHAEANATGPRQEPPQEPVVAGAHEAPLSPRERELIGLVGRGLTDRQIAGELVISLATVHSHLDRIRDKTGRRRRAQLTRLALELEVVLD